MDSYFMKLGSPDLPKVLGLLNHQYTYEMYEGLESAKYLCWNTTEEVFWYAIKHPLGALEVIGRHY